MTLANVQISYANIQWASSGICKVLADREGVNQILSTSSGTSTSPPAYHYLINRNSNVMNVIEEWRPQIF